MFFNDKPTSSKVPPVVISDRVFSPSGEFNDKRERPHTPGKNLSDRRYTDSKSEDLAPLRRQESSNPTRGTLVKAVSQFNRGGNCANGHYRERVSLGW